MYVYLCKDMLHSLYLACLRCNKELKGQSLCRERIGLAGRENREEEKSRLQREEPVKEEKRIREMPRVSQAVIQRQ